MKGNFHCENKKQKQAELPSRKMTEMIWAFNRTPAFMIIYYSSHIAYRVKYSVISSAKRKGGSDTKRDSVKTRITLQKFLPGCVAVQLGLPLDSRTLVLGIIAPFPSTQKHTSSAHCSSSKLPSYWQRGV